MNPFTESTVARPLSHPACRRFAGVPAPSRSKKRQVIARLTVGVLAGLSLPGAAYSLDVNAANQEQLRGLRGIGPKTAQVIIDERSRGGRYESLEDLSDRVKGIGPKKAAALRAAGLTAGAGPTAASAPPSGRTPGAKPKAK